LPQPLAEAGAGSSKSKLNIDSDLPLPRRGASSGKSRCTSRRWRLYFVQIYGKFFSLGNERDTDAMAR
jgi:hypothetical protein